MSRPRLFFNKPTHQLGHAFFQVNLWFPTSIHYCQGNILLIAALIHRMELTVSYIGGFANTFFQHIDQVVDGVDFITA